jgi:nucleoside-diphosphate-sugar epimerase
MRYLITGTNGFIGRSLVAKISEDINNDIFAIDLSLDTIPDAPNITKIPTDLLKIDGSNFPEVDVVIHAAALLGVDFVENNPIRTVLDNISMFGPLTKYLANNKVRFVFFSTSEAYGDGRRKEGAGILQNSENNASLPLNLPNLFDPRSSYPISKIVGEFLSNQSANSLCLRPHNIYGSQMGTRHVMPQLIDKINKAKSGDLIPMYNPQHVRSFCYIDDAIDQIIYWINSNETGPVNIGNPSEPVKIESLFKMTAKIMNKEVIMDVKTEHLTSPHYRKPKIDYDGFAFTSLTEGLEIMIRSYS